LVTQKQQFTLAKCSRLQSGPCVRITIGNKECVQNFQDISGTKIFQS